MYRIFYFLLITYLISVLQKTDFTGLNPCFNSLRMKKNQYKGSALQISTFGFSVVSQIPNNLEEQIFTYEARTDNLFLPQHKHARHRCL